MKKFRSPLEQIGGEIAGLIVNPAGGEIERNFLARGADFDGAEPVQNLFDLVYTAFGK
jgi:hypothetical protein